MTPGTRVTNIRTKKIQCLNLVNGLGEGASGYWCRAFLWGSREGLVVNLLLPGFPGWS